MGRPYKWQIVMKWYWVEGFSLNLTCDYNLMITMIRQVYIHGNHANPIHHGSDVFLTILCCAITGSAGCREEHPAQVSPRRGGLCRGIQMSQITALNHHLPLRVV
jgi:hypothetical protein